MSEKHVMISREEFMAAMEQPKNPNNAGMESVSPKTREAIYALRSALESDEAARGSGTFIYQCFIYHCEF